MGAILVITSTSERLPYENRGALRAEEATVTQPGALIRVYLIDDHLLMREGLRMLIGSNPNLVVVGDAGGWEQAKDTIAALRPHVVLLDLDLGDASGLDVLPQLLDVLPDTRVIMLTGIRDPEQHRQAVLLGAMGLVLKEKAAETVSRAIERVHAGEVWLERTLIASILNDRSRKASSAADDAELARIAQLTERERELIALVGAGLRNRQIAERLVISEATVRHHLTSIFAKLDVADRFDLALFAYRHHLAKVPQ